MLPFSTNILLSIIEFFSIVILHVIYALTQFGWEKALFVSIGFLPALLTILLYRLVKKENVIVRCFYLTMLITSYLISSMLDTLGMLIMIYFAGALVMALYAKRGLMIEYVIVSSLALIATSVFQMDIISLNMPSQIYFSYLTLYAFGMVSILFMVNGVISYKQKMEEKNEEAQNALEAKANFLANMSHEIRTPMNAIFGMAELLSKSGCGEQEKEYVDTIQKSSENLLSIINEILDFSKIDSGKMEINVAEYQFNSLIHDVLSIIEFRMKKKSVKLKTDIDPNIPRALIGDELRIRQVLINIMNNAVNFTHRGHVLLRVRFYPDNAYEGILEVAVEDTGIGISEENMEKLFKAFSQIDTKKNRNVEGTGLGLAISKNLVSMMNGEIWANSKKGCGSTFFFRIPQRIKDPRPSNYETNHDIINAQNEEFEITFKAPTARVMIVDDNKVNLKVAFELMKRFGFEATLIESGPEAINRIDEHLVEYDMIFMDHMMPFMDGVEVTSQIRKINTTYAKEIPIVALTANAINGVEKQFLDAGMNDYLSKPIHMKQLSNVLKKWLPLEKQVRMVDGKEAPQVITDEYGNVIKTLDGKSKDILDCLPGVDVEDGLRNCGGSKSVYISVLQTFASSNLISSLNEYYEAEDMENYSVISHSIKGACRNIGANKVADMAYALEKASKEKEIAFVWENHQDFADEYTAMIRTVTQAIIAQHSWM